MAYNRNFNPDALPAFAEPERKGPSSSQAASIPPRTSPAASGAQGGASHPGNYDHKPPPPLPGQPGQGQQHRVDSHGSQHSGVGVHPSHRHTPVPGVVDRRATPISHPQGNYGHSMSPPLGGPRGANTFPPGSGAPVAHRPAATSRPPPSPAPQTGGSDLTLLPLFRAVDKDGSGQLSERELGAALVNGDWSSFDPYTVRLMIRMFDSDRSGTIGFQEFCGLWSFLASWRTLFDRFDVDGSGNISLTEFTASLAAFGYRLSDKFIGLLFSMYDREHVGYLSFDLFVQSCIGLKRMTDVFKGYDDDRDGFITLSFEDFLSEILKQR